MFGVYAAEVSYNLMGAFTQELQPRDLELFQVSQTTFLFGSMVGFMLVSVYPQNQYINTRSCWSQLPLNRWIFLCRTLFFAYIFVVLLKYAFLFRRDGVLPIFNLNSVRINITNEDYNFPVFFGFQTSIGNLLFLNLGAVLAIHGGKQIGWLTMAAIIGAFLNDTTMADKGSIRSICLFVFTYALTCSIFQPKKSQIPLYTKAVFAAGAFLLLLSLITLFRRLPELRGMSTVDIVKKVTLEHFFINIIGNIPSTAWMFENPVESVYWCDNSLIDIYRFADSLGVSVFGRGIYPQGFWAERSLGYLGQVEGFGNYNTFTHLAYYYSDGGALGVRIFTGILGFVSTISYGIARRTRRIEAIQVAAMLTVVIIFSVRGLFFSGVNFWLTILLIFFQMHFIAMPRAKQLSSQKS